MTEKRARTPLSKVRIPYFEREFTPVKSARSRVRFKTVDDVIFEVCDTSIVPSTYMNRLIYGSRVNRQQSCDVTHPLPNVAADVFEKVMRYCYFHTSKYCDNLLPNQVKEWDDHFMDLDPRQLCELASAAYYLDVKDLIELTCRAIAAIISGKTAEQIRKTFHIENDLAGTIDRVLPNSARSRRGREHSPKESNRKRETDDGSSQERNQNDAQQGTPSVQKSVEELTEWINSSSSKSKKKKKKRHKDKNPARKSGDYRKNDEEVCDSETTHTLSAEAHVPDDPSEEDGPLPVCEQSVGMAVKASNDCMSSDVRDALNESKPLTSSRGLMEGGRAGSDPHHDDGSSNSDIAFVSEKLVNRAAVEEGRSRCTHFNSRKASDSLENNDQHILRPDFVNVDRAEACAAPTSDADSVELVPPTSCKPRHLKQESNASESSGDAGESSEDDAGESSEDDAGASSCQTEAFAVENADGVEMPVSEGDAPSQVKADERKPDLAAARPAKEEVSIVDVPGNSASPPPAPGEQSSDEPFIDCPENMDREVEAFQQRLSITEPLSSHRNTSQIGSLPPLVTERKGKSMTVSINADGPWTANGLVSESCGENRLGDGPESSTERTVIDISQEGREQIRRDDGRGAVVKHSSIPKKVLAELLRINSEKEEFQKIAAAIDEETARLGAKREKVRDSLAVLNMQERQLRQKYNVSDQFP